MQLSVITPIYNEEENISVFITELKKHLAQITEDFEVIFVDDGSTDKSLELLIDAHKNDKRYKVLSLSRNFGHQAAYTAGLEFSKGKYIVMLDADMQDPPEYIVKLYEEINSKDLDVVYAYRTDRKEKGLKKLFIKLFHVVFSKMSSHNVPTNVGNFSIMTRQVLIALLNQREKNRYLPGLRSFVGFKQGVINYTRPDRAFGQPKMTYRKLFNLAIDAIFSFSNIPIRICLYLGLFGITISLIVGTYSLISKILGIASPGWSSTLISIYLFGSIQLIFLGVLGEYVFRIYKEVQNRSTFIIRKYYED